MTSPSKRLPKPVGLAIVALVVVALVAGLVKLYDGVFGVADYSGSGSGSVVVQIRNGDSAAAIGETLVERGVVKSAKAFTRAAKKDSRSRSLQPGFYQLRLKMAASKALSLLLDPASRKRGRVTIPEGSPLASVVDRMVKSTELTRPEILEALGNPAVLGLPSYSGGKPEGFLFPATYDIEPGTPAVDALQMMTQKFAEEADAVGLEAGAAELGLKPYEVLIIASLIEKETPLVEEEGPKVARVVLNRLQAGMRLQFDSTLNYVLAERKARLTNDDLGNDTPYNTYRHDGLPPTPIGNPGAKALEAALHPAVGDYIYFVTIDKQGHSLFTASYDEFLAAKAKAKRDGVY